MRFLLLSSLLGFFTVFVGVPAAKKYLMSSGIYGIDQQKNNRPKIPTSGGLVVLFGFIVAVTSFIGLNQLFGSRSINLALVLAALNSVTIIALIGLIDDIHIDLQKLITEHVEEEVEIELETEKTHFIERFILRFSNDKDDSMIHRTGLSQIPKMLFVLPAALPLIAVGAGSWEMSLPLIGVVNWGLLYPLVLLPLGLLFVSNVVNMLAGMNGLSAAMSLVASLGLGVFALSNGRMEAALIALSASSCLLAFLWYNFYPASILPGDSLTYLAGAVLFASMVVGNIEKFGAFIFAPWYAEFLLSARSGFNSHSWGTLKENGKLEPQHPKNYSLTIPLMKRGFTEKQITLILTSVEVVVIIIGFVLFL
ncbi:MAG: hypothetical protein H8Z69_02750 [Nanohaloarchaea archaeon]|nr:hypothetical protein [Candidatus Nanohaloarchaea archaeon]